MKPLKYIYKICGTLEDPIYNKVRKLLSNIEKIDVSDWQDKYFILILNISRSTLEYIESKNGSIPNSR